ncbi:MAG TPA: FAD-dependent oxidoreductase, partial [Nitrosopumilaceae archaeon]|nr:FAD-dependent oxidoreductase [Nitrosopumilaceae archaeon]
MDYDVVIAGGSIAGLICAREIAEKGHRVLVIEEDYEIGTPEHCGGLVSVTGLQELGVIPHRKTYEHRIETAEIFSPNGKSFVINSTKQNVVEINRRELDKQIAHQAQQNGAEIRVKTSFQGIT